MANESSKPTSFTDRIRPRQPQTFHSQPTQPSEISDSGATFAERKATMQKTQPPRTAESTEPVQASTSARSVLVTPSTRSSQSVVIIEEENNYPFAHIDFVRVGSAHAVCEPHQDAENIDLLRRVSTHILHRYQPELLPAKVSLEYKSVSSNTTSSLVDSDAYSETDADFETSHNTNSSHHSSTPSNSNTVNSSSTTTTSTDNHSLTYPTATDVSPSSFQSSSPFSTQSPSPLKHFEPSFLDRRWLKGLYLCVLVQGQLPSGHRGYCYFGVFADTFITFIDRYQAHQPFNPIQLKAIVLARSTGQPSPEIREFMKMKFSFHETLVILEVSR